MWTKILGFAVAIGALLLMFLAISESKRADYWANFERTRAARAARHVKKEPEPSETDETETDLNELETLNANSSAENN
jgi:hypothetical protein